MADDGNKRRSNAVSLTILGLFATVFIADKAIPAATEMRRNVYANRADCERDYPPSQCEADNGGSYSSGGGGYHGPYYTASRSSAPAGDPGPGRTGAIRASYETSYRGGFGAIGRTIHAVG
jgi:hypothetical protein